jgi:hypothetical protein
VGYDEAVIVRLRELLNKYDRLIELRLAPPERTPARRAAMQEVARLFPGALREWDALPLAELMRRRDEVARGPEVLAEIGAQPGLAWLRYSLDLHEHLRALLRGPREERRGRPSEIAYAAIASRYGVSVAEVKRALFQPPAE